MTILELFRTGKDTSEIATLLGMTEAMVYNLMASEKREERSTVQFPKGRIAYAGREDRP